MVRDPGRNVNPPTGDLVNSGWQYEGGWHGFTGTVIGPHNFLSAAHVGGYPGAPFIFQGKTYRAVDAVGVPNTDLCVWRVEGTFPTWAQIYAKDTPVGKDVVMFGRGLDRGAPIRINNQIRGWRYGGVDERMSWGRSWIKGVTDGTGDRRAAANYGKALLLPFDADAGPDAGSVAPGDSGGGVFIKDDDGVWKLAGIIYGVETGFYRDAEGREPLLGSLFDTRGIYRKTVTGSTARVDTAALDAAPTNAIVSSTAPYIDGIRNAVISTTHIRRLLLNLALIVVIPLFLVAAMVFFAMRRVRGSAGRRSSDDLLAESIDDE